MNKLIIFILSFLVACGPSEEEIQLQIDEAVEEALQEVSTTNTSTTSTSTSTTSTSTSTTSTSTSTTSTSTSTTSTSTSTTSTTLYVDNEPPTWPDKTVTIGNMNPTYFEVQWKPASDNSNVAGYRFYLNNIFKGEYIRKNDNNSIFLDGLSPETTYTLEIVAYDDDTNQSIENPILSITTAAPPTTTTTTLLTSSDNLVEELVTVGYFIGKNGNVTAQFQCNTPEYIYPQVVVGNAYPTIKQYPDFTTPYGAVVGDDYTGDGFDLVSLSIVSGIVEAVFTPVSQETFDSKGLDEQDWHMWAILYECEWMVRTYP